jgi:hypothetical protein
MWTCSRCGEKVDDGFGVCWACGTTIDGVRDPSFFHEERGPAEENQALAGPVEDTLQDLVTVARFTYPHQAHAAKVRLEAEGIRVFLADEFTVTMDWFLSNAVGGIKVNVPGEDAERAQEILAKLTERPGRDEPSDYDEEEP